MHDEGHRDDARFAMRRLRDRMDWGDAESRFVAGLVVFLVAALLYPWYEYRVQAWLAARDQAAAARVLEQAMGAEAAALQPTPDAAAPGPRAVADAAAANIRIMGAMELRDGPLAIVDLAGSALEDARPVICLRVQEILRAPMPGRDIRVQRWRRNAPAVSMGAIQC